MTEKTQLEKMRELVELANKVRADLKFSFPESMEMMKKLTKEDIQVQYLLIQCRDADRDEWRKIAISWLRRAIQAEENHATIMEEVLNQHAKTLADLDAEIVRLRLSRREPGC